MLPVFVDAAAELGDGGQGKNARLRASLTATSGAWLQALPISSVGLRMDDDVIRVAVGLRLGTNLCEPHTCTCGVPVDARGTPTGWSANEVQDVIPATACSTTSCGARCCEPRYRPARNRRVSAGPTVSVRTVSLSSLGLGAAA